MAEAEAGLSALQAEKHAEAIEHLTNAIDDDDSNAMLFFHRAQAFLKSNQQTDALSDIRSALQLDGGNAEFHKFAGDLYLNMQQYKPAHEALTKYLELGGPSDQVQTQLEACAPHINASASAPSSEEPFGAKTLKQAQDMFGLKHDWYQSDSHVFITIMVKKLTEDAVKIDLEATKVTVAFTIPNGDDYRLALPLFAAILADQSATKVKSVKVELKLCKAEPLQWPSVEQAQQAVPVAMMQSAADVGQQASAASSKNSPNDWDQLAKEVEEVQLLHMRTLCQAGPVVSGVVLLEWTSKVCQCMHCLPSHCCRKRRTRSLKGTQR
eukprot:TRINITY_DN6350_c0_g1_i1.p1 TRINITY_DN6350_c0_g1~~TRINITY_DN6350_c0_g1_i1.p1  ORF type:complete len:324 (+),score=63.85 TRINITY_DN6350_c0_g1_i1:40-1011(+)